MALPAPRRGASYSAFNFNYIIISINCIIRSDEIGGNDNRKKENRDRRAGGAGPSSGRCYYRKRCAIGGATEDFTAEFVATAAGLQAYEQFHHLSDAAAAQAADHTGDARRILWKRCAIGGATEDFMVGLVSTADWSQADHAADHTGDARRGYRRRRYVSGHRSGQYDRDDHYH